MEKMKLLIVDLKQINLEDKKFCLSPLIEYNNLMTSIARVGLLTPPLVKASAKGLILVNGWRRVLACSELKMMTIPVIVEPKEINDLDLLIRAIEENLTTRRLSLAEKAQGVYKLNVFGLSEERIISDFFPRLALPQKREYFVLLKQIASEGSEELKKCLHKAEISLEALSLLTSFSPVVQKKLIPLLEASTYSRRREIIFHLHELALKKGILTDDLLQTEEVKAILENKNLSLRLRGEALAEWLKRKRYPLITSWEERIKEVLKELAWPEGVNLSYDPSFEEAELRISFSFLNSEQFTRYVDQLREIAKKPSFLKLFRRTWNE